MKRILSLDGGGVRGVFTLQILRRIESLFRQRNDQPSLVLADEFDLFAGTSTGAIIATGLCWGMSVDEIETLYLQEGHRMFCRAPWYRRYLAKYRSDRLADLFCELFVEPESNAVAELGSDSLRGLLLVVVRNATTGSPWLLSSNPNAKYNDRTLANCNLSIPIWQVLRASTAAPTYFGPETIRLGDDQFLFVDGALTPYNNPALIAFLYATLPQYRVNWDASPEKLHLVSIGTGGSRAHLPHKPSVKINLVDQLSHVVPALIGAASVEQDFLCRVFGDCLHGDPLDVELGDLLAPTLLRPAEQKLSYVRYNQDLSSPEATRRGGLKSQRIDDLRLMPQLISLGKQYADKHVKLEHLQPRNDK